MVEALRPETRGPGLGLYSLWDYAVGAALPALAGVLKDRVGTEAAVVFAVAQRVGTLALIGLCRSEQRRLAAA